MENVQWFGDVTGGFLNSALRSLEPERCYTHVTPSSVLAERQDEELKANGGCFHPRISL